MPTLIWDPTAISFYEKFYPLRFFGTLQQLGTTSFFDNCREVISALALSLIATFLLKLETMLALVAPLTYF